MLTVGKNDGSGTFSGVITQASVHVTGLTKKRRHPDSHGSDDYKGATTINGGTLLGDGGLTGTLGSGAVTIESGAFLTINRSDNYGTTYNQSFSGAGTLVKEGAGDLVIMETTTQTTPFRTSRTSPSITVLSALTITARGKAI